MTASPAERPTVARGARLAGLLYLATFATSIPALALKTPALDVGAPLTAGVATAATWGTVLEVLLAVACVGTALLLLRAIRPAGDARAFLLGPGLIPALNAALLATALLRLRAVPRAIPVIGLIGAPLLAASALGTLLGAFDQVSAVAGALALPIAAWELALGLWLTVRGVRVAETRRVLSDTMSR